MPQRIRDEKPFKIKYMLILCSFEWTRHNQNTSFKQTDKTCRRTAALLTFDQNKLSIKKSS